MSKATWRPEEQAWLDANPHGLPTASLYGTRGMGGYAGMVGPSSASAKSAPWQALSEREVAAWRLAHPAATCSDRSARCLAWLAREWGAR